MKKRMKFINPNETKIKNSSVFLLFLLNNAMIQYIITIKLIGTSICEKKTDTKFFSVKYVG